MLLGIIKYIIVSIMMFIIVILVGNIFENKILANLCQVIAGGGFYFIVMWILKDKVQVEILEKARKLLLKNK